MGAGHEGVPAKGNATVLVGGKPKLVNKEQVGPAIGVENWLPDAETWRRPWRPRSALWRGRRQRLLG